MAIWLSPPSLTLKELSTQFGMPSSLWPLPGMPKAMGTSGSEQLAKCATQQTSKVSGCHHYPAPDRQLLWSNSLQGNVGYTQKPGNLTKALVWSHLTDGHEAFITTTDSLWLDLEWAELLALKVALGLPRCAINNLVYQEVGWLLLSEESCLRCAHYKALPIKHTWLHLYLSLHIPIETCSV